MLQSESVCLEHSGCEARISKCEENDRDILMRLRALEMAVWKAAGACGVITAVVIVFFGEGDALMWASVGRFFRTGMGFYTGLFVCAYLAAWAYNALKGGHFDLDKLSDLYKWLIGSHLVDSGLNTPVPAIEQLKGAVSNGLVSLESIRTMAEEACGRIFDLAAAKDREPVIFLHWSAGHYNQDFDDYHIRIDSGGEIYANDDLAAVLSHTWHQNSGSVGVAMLCCAFANTTSLGDEPPTDAQIETMARVVAVLCQALGLSCDYGHVRTHAEQADIDGYGPATTCERWDLWFLREDQARGSGGEILRGKAIWYIENGVGV